MSRRTASVVAWSVVGVSAVLGGLGTGMTLAADGFDGSERLFEEAFGMLIFASVGAVGALIASRLPSNPIGWIFLGLVLALALSGPADSYVALVADDARPGELAAWAAWYSAKLFIAFFATIFFAVLLFPNGRLPSPRWRPVLWIGSAGLLVFCVTVLIRPGPMMRSRATPIRRASIFPAAERCSASASSSSRSRSPSRPCRSLCASGRRAGSSSSS